jgi:uncharacterized delta-60 repeat protein
MRIFFHISYLFSLILISACGNGLCPLKTSELVCHGIGINWSSPLGILDTSFGTGGFSSLSFFTGGDSASVIKVQSDGNILLGGSIVNGGNNDIGVAKFSSEGILDTNFGTNGRGFVDFAAGNDSCYAMYIQPDGKIILGGDATSGTINFALARLNAQGVVDTTFGTGGRTTTDFAGSVDSATAMLIEASGKIVLGGYSGVTPDFALARYYSGGVLDTTFGTGGRTTTDFAVDQDFGLAMAFQSDGKIILVGTAIVAGDTDFAIARYSIDGILDTTFGTGGRTTTDFFGLVDTARSVIIQSNGKIIVGGTISNGGINDFGLARYTSNGILDTTFGTGGKTSTDFAGANDNLYSIAIQNDGKIVAVGSALIMSTNFALARYSSEGILDTSFGTNGITTSDFGALFSLARAVFLLPNGNILAAGLGNIGAINRFVIARYK